MDRLVGLARRHPLHLPVLGFSVIGAAALLLSTRWGIGASPDSAVYIGVARNLLDGRGLTVPFGATLGSALTQFPPAYPLLLAGIGSIGIDVQEGARWLNVVLFGATMALVAVMLRRLQSSRMWIPVAGAFGVLVSPPLLAVYGMAWSEPMFLCLGFSGLVLLSSHVGHGRESRLLLSGVLIGAAFLTRYAGIAFVATGVVGLLALGKRSLRSRAADSLVFAVISMLPVSVWGLTNLKAVGTVTGRQLVFHPMQIGHAAQALNTITSWLLVPANTSGFLKAGLLMGISIWALAAARLWLKARQAVPDSPASTESDPGGALILLLVCFTAVYGLFLLLSLSLFDANIPLDDRILSPAYLAGLTVLVFLGGEAMHRLSSLRVAQSALAALVILFIVGSISRDLGHVVDGYRNGTGLNSRLWRDSPTLARLEAVPVQGPIFSNSPEAIYLRSGRSAFRLPRVFRLSDSEPNTDYVAELQAMERRLAEEAGVIVYFTAIQGRSFPSEAELQEALPLTPITSASDGTIYVLASAP